MSMQSCLVFDSKEKCNHIIKKYNWAKSMYYIEDKEENCMRNYCVCMIYPPCGGTSGIGFCTIAPSACSEKELNRFHQLVKALDQRKADEMKLEFSNTVFGDIINWAEIIRDNIVYLENIGFLIHWDDCDFSNIEFKKKEYGKLMMTDLLTVQEDIVLWITKD